MPIRTCTKTPMLNWSGTTVPMGASLYPSSGLGNGNLPGVLRTKGEAGEIHAAYALSSLRLWRLHTRAHPKLLTILWGQFVEYDQRAHRLDTLMSFSFFVASEFACVDPRRGEDSFSRLCRSLPVPKPSQLAVTPASPQCAAQSPSRIGTIAGVTNQRCSGAG